MAVLDWLRLVAPDNATEMGALEAGAGRNLGYVRVVGRRRADAPLYDPVVSIPMWCSTASPPMARTWVRKAVYFAISFTRSSP